MQDLSHAVTKGRWKIPKHILICMTIRHLYRSKTLTQILHRLGYCENYDYGLELETAISQALDESSSQVTPQIVKGDDIVVFHMELDNLNKMTSSMHGLNIIKADTLLDFCSSPI